MSDKYYMSKTYKVEEVFEDIPGDPDNVLLNIPPEILEQLGWEPGDVLTVSTKEGSIVLEKKDNG